MKKILVIGSLNIDFSIKVPSIPKPGETINAEGMEMGNGGKGANQAYTIGKLGGNVKMLGCVGNDIYGKNIKQDLKNGGVNVDNIHEASHTETGKAFIYVDNNGENCIAIIHGSNYALTKDIIIKHQNLIEDADIILMQLEIPLETIKTVLELAKDKIIILDPAPANKDILKFDLSNVFLMKPNETELSILTGTNVENETSIIEAAKVLLDKGVKNVIVSLGQKGSFLINKQGQKYFEALSTNTVDTTAAGDSFVAGITLGLSKDYSLEESIIHASHIAALTVSKKGALNSIPSIKELEEYEKKNNN